MLILWFIVPQGRNNTPIKVNFSKVPNFTLIDAGMYCDDAINF